MKALNSLPITIHLKNKDITLKDILNNPNLAVCQNKVAETINKLKERQPEITDLICIYFTKDDCWGEVTSGLATERAIYLCELLKADLLNNNEEEEED